MSDDWESLRGWEGFAAKELHPRERHLPLGRHSDVNKGLSENAEVTTDLHDTAHGELGEHDDWHNFRTDSVWNGMCLQLSVKDWKQNWHGILESIETRGSSTGAWTAPETLRIFQENRGVRTILPLKEIQRHTTDEVFDERSERP